MWRMWCEQRCINSRRLQLVLGIDIGGNQIRAGMVDEEGAILASRTIQTPADLDTFLPSLQDAIQWLVESTAFPPEWAWAARA